MVVIHAKRTDLNQYLSEFKTTDKTDDIILELVKINNLRILVDRLCSAIEELSTFGPIKPEE